MTRPSREPFDWLADPQTRHGGLAMIETAIRRGWLEGGAAPSWWTGAAGSSRR